MTLVTRVSAFFLGALACILAAYSVLLFLTARSYLDRQFDEQLRASLNTLVAAVEVEDDDVKWEPSDHTVELGVETGVEDVRWVVVDERGEPMDVSRNLLPPRIAGVVFPPPPTSPAAEGEARAILEFARTWRNGQQLSPDGRWRFLQYRLAAPHPKAAELRDKLEREQLVVTVARSTRDLHATLAWLGTLLVVAPALCWLLAAGIGRWFTRKALAPVREMAAASRLMKPDSPELRLPVASTDDELADLGRAFNGVLDQLFTAYERQRQFAGDAAHQLRTPVTVLQGQVDVALRRPRATEEYVDTLRTVQGQVGELRQTIEAMLMLARPPGEVETAASIDLRDLLAASPSRWQSHTRFVDLSVQPADSPVLCRVSPAMFGQLLDNLIGNAFKYSNPGSPVAVMCRREGGSAVVEVADQGIGIEPAAQREIFEPFYRTRQARQTGAAGTGLGLPIARRIAESLGGRLTVESTPGRGSVFRLILPHAGSLEPEAPR